MQEMMDYIKATLDGKIDHIEESFGEVALVAFPDTILEVLRVLRDDVQLQFNNFIDLCGVDYPERKKRFDVVYHLLSPRQNKRIRVKVATDSQTPLPSAMGVFAGVEWFEREAYDLYGILFNGHPDLRRILTDYGFEGHPLRKDFPLTGYSEVRYDDVQKRVVYEPVKLRQEFRDFDFLSPWEGVDYEIPNELIGDEKASKENGSKGNPAKGEASSGNTSKDGK